MIYVAHPYSGLEENKISVENIVSDLTLKHNKTFISPIHAFGFLYHKMEYEPGLELCLNLLKRCDAIIFCDKWETSKGCRKEFEVATELGIKIYTSLEEFEKDNNEI